MHTRFSQDSASGESPAAASESPLRSASPAAASAPVQAEHLGDRTFRVVLVVVLVLSAVMLTWRYVFIPVSARVRCEPAWLPPDGMSLSLVRVDFINRLGFAVPNAAPVLHCEILEGAALITVGSSMDSTALLLKAGSTSGIVEMRIYARGWPLPLLCTLVIQPATAEGLVPSAQPSAAPQPCDRGAAMPDTAVCRTVRVAVPGTAVRRAVRVAVPGTAVHRAVRVAVSGTAVRRTVRVAVPGTAAGNQDQGPRRGDIPTKTIKKPEYPII